MSIREATVSDLPAIAEACAQAFMNEELFGDLMHPHRREYPQDFLHFWERKIGKHLIDPKWKILVSVDASSGRVTGTAKWYRQGVGSDEWASAHPITETVKTDVARYLDALPTENRACNPATMTVLEDSLPFAAHLWSGPRAAHWGLDLLAVHPDSGGKGHGRRLVQWGVDEASKEGVAASVVSAWGVEPFYESCGFTYVGSSTLGPLLDHGVKGGAVLFIDKKG